MGDDERLEAEVLRVIEQLGRQGEAGLPGTVAALQQVERWQSPTERVLFFCHDGVQAILRPFSAFPDRVEVVTAVCRALATFADHELVKQALVRHGTIQLVVAAMEAHPACAELQDAACDVLATIASTCDAGRLQTRETGGISAILASMVNLSGVDAVEEATVVALHALTFGDSTSGKAVVMEGGVERLIALHMRTGSALAREWSLRALRNLIVQDSATVRRRLEAAEGVPSSLVQEVLGRAGEFEEERHPPRSPSRLRALPQPPPLDALADSQGAAAAAASPPRTPTNEPYRPMAASEAAGTGLAVDPELVADLLHRIQDLEAQLQRYQGDAPSTPSPTRSPPFPVPSGASLPSSSSGAAGFDPVVPTGPKGLMEQQLQAACQLWEEAHNRHERAEREKREVEEDLTEQFNTILVAERNLHKQVVDAREAALTAVRAGNHAIPVKMLGALNQRRLMHAGLEPGQMAELDELTRGLGHFIVDVHTAAHPRRALEATKRQELLHAWGAEVAAEVERAAVELDKFNPSGFYPVTLPWHFRENRELSPAEIILLLAGCLSRHAVV